MFALGATLALLQMGYVFSIQLMLSSTVTGYLFILTAWLVGAIAGVNARRAQSLSGPLLAAIGCYYLSHLLLAAAPFNEKLLVVHAVLSSSGGFLGGVLFPIGRAWFAQVRDMLFHENNGLLCGIAASFIGTTLYGHAFLFIGPAALAAMLQLGRLWCSAHVRTQQPAGGAT